MLAEKNNDSSTGGMKNETYSLSPISASFSALQGTWGDGIQQ